VQAVEVDGAVGRPLGQAVRDEQGRVLLAAGVRLTPSLVALLRRRGFRRVWVAEGMPGEVPPSELLAPTTRALAEAAVHDAFRRAAAGAAVPVAEVTRAVDAILADVEAVPDVAWELDALRSVSAYNYVHSVNVCVYSLLIARELGWPPPELRRLGVGALLHDLGKVFYADLCNKPGRLTEEERRQVERHTVEGFEILRRQRALHLFVAHVAFQHHERLDGQGYPRGLPGDRILPDARVVAVADVYDAMTADRPYAPAAPAAEALAELQRGAGVRYDAEAVRALVRRLAVYPTGTPVRLADGSVAVVVGQTADPHAPRVRLLAHGGRPSPPEELSATGPRQIREVLAAWPPRLGDAAGSPGGGTRR
jgi:putative nucleotidyltransferase with HDIG domain